MTQAYPLQWPDGWPRTPPGERRRNSPFKVASNTCRRELLDNLRMLGAEHVVVSSDVPVRADGTPYADAARRIIRNPGVAVYFTLKGHQVVMARDRFDRVEDNIRSIGLALEAIRAVERHGGSTMMERAFAGFTALPPPCSHWDILGVPPTATVEQIEAAYRAVAREAHPDAGGSHARMSEINAARDAAIKERTGK
ncbi:J domain-containing protein [uncultured Hyphomicrobium sp.]|uniref:J domain-containing protein n=1 Tax=uncultured Hyphomicrobium sp. TaxID=194373 RepID=UPI0025DE1228|nr:J domain-containing protein [uncultured Hyphomicrobium sp.]